MLSLEILAAGRMR